MSVKTSSNTKQAFWVGLGSLFSFGFSLLCAAILSRYLTKDEYGTYKQVMYVYNTLLVVFTLGLPRAYSYFLPRVKLEEGESLVKKLNCCFLLLGGIFSCALYFSSDLMANILNNRNLIIPLKLFAPTPLFLLPTMGLEGVLATYRKTEWNAIYIIATRLFSMLFVALPVIFYKSDCNVAISGFTVSSIITCIIGVYFMYLPFRGINTKRSTAITLKEILKFSWPLMFAGFWGIAEKSAGQFYISRFFGESIFADYANGSLELPFAGMVLSAGSVVLLPLFSRIASDDTVDNHEIIILWRAAAIKAAYILYPLVAFAWFYSEYIMVFLYGAQYADSSIYFKIVLISNFFTIAQYAPILLSLGKTKEYSAVLMFSAIIVWFLDYICISLFANPYILTGIGVVVTIAKITFFIKLIARLLGCPTKELFPYGILTRIIFSSLLGALMSFILINIFLLNTNSFIKLFIGFILFVLIEVIISIAFNLKYSEFLPNSILKRFKK